MAGIGFELKRLFAKKSIAAKITGTLHSVFATVGHFIIVIVVNLMVRILIEYIGVSDDIKNIYSCIVLYSFIFPLIFTSGFSIVITRYIADILYENKQSDILSSLYGLITVYSVIVSPIAILFLWFTDVSFYTKFGAYLLFMGIGITFLLMVYISAVKKFKIISFGFLIGMTVTILLSYLFLKYGFMDFEILTLLVFAFAIGILITALILFFSIKRCFRKSSNNYFDFFLYIKRYPLLLFANLFYTIGLYSQNFVFWANKQTSDKILNFVFSTDYDLATALGVITTLSVSVIFVVRMETTFYSHYRKYLNSINFQTGNMINKAKRAMQKSIWQEYFFVIEVQTIISLAFIVLGIAILPKINIQSTVITMYPFLTCGYMFVFLMFITMTVMMYFENYKDSIKVSIVFMLLTTIFTQITVMLGEDFYGIGIIFSAIISFVVAVYFLIKTINNVDYLIFCRSSLISEDNTVFLRKVIKCLNGRAKQK